MKRLISLCAAGCALTAATAASAADLSMPVKALPPAPVLAPVPVWNWTGLYAGANLGYSWGHWNNSGLASTATPDVKGWLGGLQAGYNWQVNNGFLLGVEADIQITGERASEGAGGAFTTDVAGPQQGFHTITSGSSSNNWKFPWFGTLRGRVGGLLDPTLLVYGTGGLAFGNFKMTSQQTVTTQSFRGTVGTTTNPLGPPVTTVGASLTDRETRLGWTLGAGLEKKFSQRWSAKLEYLYLDFGRRTFLAGTGLDTKVRLRDQIVRVGINYQF